MWAHKMPTQLWQQIKKPSNKQKDLQDEAALADSAAQGTERF